MQRKVDLIFDPIHSLDPIDDNVVLEQIVKNVEAITNHQERYQQNATVDRRVLEKIVGVFGQPQFLYGQIVFFTVWGVFSHTVDRAILPADFPLFDLREQLLDVAALFISTAVLIYQTRQEELSEQRSHLMLQLNLITEQKIAKLISLVEELRTDLPNVSNRHDLEAEIMQQAIDPQAILEVIQQNAAPSASLPTETQL
jgi:uncharacterized membrane protein